MGKKSENIVYQPGYYGKKRPAVSTWVDANIRMWQQDSRQRSAEKEIPMIRTVCFSRKIGVGALEIADILSEIIQYRVVDREIIEHMARETNLTQKVIEFYDERYPGRMSEVFSVLTSERTFIKSDYARQLVQTVNALAGTEPTIFVGRGTHLILPRETVLSVRLVCSKAYRIDRLAAMLNISKSEAEKKLEGLDKEQYNFFKTVYHKTDAPLEEFDLVINRDHIKEASQAARIVACAFEQKFGLEKSKS